MSRAWVIGVSVVLAVAAAADVAATQEAPAQERNRSGPDRQIQISLQYVPIVATDARKLGIDWVTLADGQSALFADAGKGVGREDLDRLDTSFIPLLGNLTGPSYSARDVTPASRVGSAWFLDRVLFVALDAARTNIRIQPRIVILNGKSAFLLSAQPIVLDWRGEEELAPIGSLPPFRRFATESVSVPESDAILISGLDTRAAADSASRVPGLSDIPLLGRMFAGSVHQNDPKELIILIRPSIVASDSDD